MIRNLKYIAFISIIAVLVISCQQALVKKEDKIAEVDSSLFFKQVEIDDPFLDKLSTNPNQTFTLQKTIIPPLLPEPEKSNFKTIEGFRVQIFAGVDSINALANKSIAKNMVKDTIYHFNDKGLVKLQVGDYPYYPQADSIKRIFRQTHFPGAWVVKTNIFIPITETDLDSTQNIFSQGIFKIQVIATGDENKAQTIVNELKMKFSSKVFYEGDGNIFKVFVGYFNKEDEARAALESIRAESFPDAWLVY